MDQNEYRELNNELVVPAYRKFCRDHDLPFHFWDELAPDAHDPAINLKEFSLHHEAMNLFNRLKPDVVLYNGRVIRFQFDSWDSFRYSSWPVNQFLEEACDSICHARQLERRCASLASGLAIMILLVVGIGFERIAVVGFGIENPLFVQGAFWLSFGVSIGLGIFLYRKCLRVQSTILSAKEKREFEDRLTKLRLALRNANGEI